MTWAANLERVDRAVLKHLDDTTVTYAPEVGPPVTGIRGLFDRAHVHVDTGTAGVESVGPAVFVRLSDLPVDPENDNPLLTIGGITYRPRSRHRDGQGGMMILLNRVGA